MTRTGTLPSSGAKPPRKTLHAALGRAFGSQAGPPPRPDSAVRRNRIAVALLLIGMVVSSAAFANSTSRAPPHSPQPLRVLAETLGALSDACIKRASTFASQERLSAYRELVDQRNDAAGLREEVQLYRRGHDQAQTDQYSVIRSQSLAEKHNAVTALTTKTSQAMAREVDGCRQRNASAGERAIAAFARQRSPAQDPDLKLLSNAWLAFIATVNTTTPEGSADARTAWQSARWHIETDGY